MTYGKFPFKKFGIRRLAFAKAEKCLFFKNDSCLSNCQVVFTKKPNQTTTFLQTLSCKLCVGGFGSE